MKRFVVAALVTVLAGCASTQPARISDTVAMSYQGKPVHVVHEAPDPFLPMTSGGGMFGAVGVAAAAGGGQAFVTQNGLTDPSRLIEDPLVDTIVAKYQMSGRGETLDFTSAKRPSDLAKWAEAKGLTGMLVDVSTRSWGYIYDGFDYSHYFARYAGNLKLIDIGTGKTIAGDLCVKDSKSLSGGKLYTQDELVADNAALLKQLFSAMAQSCLEEFKAKALS